MLLFFSEVYSQAISWRKSFRTYGNPGNSWINDIEQTNEGGYIMVGRSPNAAGFAMGISPYGDSLWFKEYQFSTGKILRLNDGNFIVRSPNGALAKINSVGDTIWTKPRPFDNLTVRGFRYINNEFYMCGERSPNPYQPYFLKLDSMGDLIFYKEYAFADYGRTLDFVVSNEYIMLYGTGHFDIPPYTTIIFFIKTDIEGNLVWLKNYEIIGINFNAFSIIKTPFEETFILGGVGVVNGNSSAALMKIDSSANIVWRKYYDQGGDALGNIDNIINDKNGGIISLGIGIGDSSVWTPNTIRLIKFDYEGNEQWRKRFGIPNEGIDPISFRQTRDSGYIIGGATPAGDYPIHIIKTNKFGDAPPPVSVNNISEIFPDDIKLYQNYPNPFNPSTTIKFELNKAAKIEISIFDIKGKLLTTFADSKYEAGIHTVIYEPEGLSSGIYFYNLKSDKIIITKKLTYLK
jgi:hypothetical protein